ncbi:hypothetical protein BDR22DRAFT_550215 [Usnea florida]
MRGRCRRWKVSPSRARFSCTGPIFQPRNRLRNSLGGKDRCRSDAVMPYGGLAAAHHRCQSSRRKCHNLRITELSDDGPIVGELLTPTKPILLRAPSWPATNGPLCVCPEKIDEVQSRPPLNDRTATMLPYPFNLPKTAYCGAVKLQQNTPCHAQIYIYTTGSIRSGYGWARMAGLHRFTHMCLWECGCPTEEEGNYLSCRFFSWSRGKKE